MQDFQAGLMLVEKTKPQKSYKYPLKSQNVQWETRNGEKSEVSRQGFVKNHWNHRHVTAILTPPMG